LGEAEREGGIGVDERPDKKGSEPKSEDFRGYGVLLRL
jgi:hypothetical protein